MCTSYSELPWNISTMGSIQEISTHLHKLISSAAQLISLYGRQRDIEKAVDKEKDRNI